MIIVEDQPFVERISPFDMFVDPEATCLEDANWIAQRIVRPLEEAKKDKRYKASARKKLDADNILYPLNSPTSRQQQEEYLYDEERTVVFEFYDIVNNTISVLKNQNYIHGIIHPQPFSDMPNSSRATKSLLFIMINLMQV